MRSVIWIARCALFLAVQSVQAAPASSDSAGGQQAAAAESTADTAAASSTTGETWRYRKHNGLWWYWLPSSKWAYWTGDRWAAYDPQTYADFSANRQTQSYSYPQTGNWGNVRYNQYGQRQWPYSQRTSGLQQLGPVPAMGGVRSLPGWGGER